MTAGHDALARQLRSTPPAELGALDDAQAQDLADALREARRNQSAQLQEAATEALSSIPRPLRGTVRKVVGL